MKKIIRTLLIASASLLLGLSACGPTAGSATNYDSYVKSVTVDSKTAELEVGGTQQLVATIEFKDGKEHQIDAKWTSSDPNVVSVTYSATNPLSAVITAKTGGDANICFIAGYKMDFCAVHVISDDPTPVPPPGPTPGGFTITMNVATLSLNIGESDQLVATPSEPTNVTWASSNMDVVSVDQNGNITGLLEGTSVITASARGVTASCSVTVGIEETDCTIYFFIDYNNIDENDKTGTKLLATFDWYTDRPISESGKVPANPTQAMDPAFPYFKGWSSHTIIDDLSQLWNMTTDVVGTNNFLFLYGIWMEA